MVIARSRRKLAHQSVLAERVIFALDAGPRAHYVTSMNLNHCSTVRMTASRAAEMFRTATPITVDQLTEQHLDMLQLSDVDRETRWALGDASDAIQAGNRRAPAVRQCVAAYNRLACL
jgi:hypothetical protein